MLQVSPQSETGFTQFSLRSDIQRGIALLGFAEPRAIQAQTIPAVLEGRDVLGLAQTGTGKTAAFALPILERLLETRKPGPRALIVAPTRELAMQIHAEITTLAKFTGLKSATIFGGVPSGPQIRNLRARPDILIACPGRLLDLAEQRFVKFDGIETLVLDEADHMFDMGFLPDLRRILEMLPAKRQNLMFSATMPNEIRTLADRILQNPHVVELGHSRPAPTIDHALYVVSSGQKLDLLNHVLAADKATSAIVFMRTKHRAKRLALQLSKVGHQAVSLEGNMSQAQRDRAMNGFRKGQFKVLVATDIAARGVDVAHVSHVINFDVPTTPDAYTHRIGRTGRAERSGRAYTFAAVDELPAVHAIERRLKSKIVRLTVPTLATVVVAQVESRDRTPEARTSESESSRGPRKSWGQARRHNGRPGARSFTGRPA